MYSGGESEAILGSMDAWKGVTPMATKVGQKGVIFSSSFSSFNISHFLGQINPWEGKGLGERSVREQVEASLARLKVSQPLGNHEPLF